MYLTYVYSESEAIVVAYFRGYAVEQVQSDGGAMMAAGLSFDAAESLINQMGLSTQVCVACINSPENVTLSGQRNALDIMSKEIGAMNKFCRLLDTGGRAYHSPMMKPVGTLYQNLLTTHLPVRCTPKSLDALMYSTVGHDYGQPFVINGSMDMNYWRENLEKPVQFSSAFESLISNRDYHLIEIGPHSSLRGPIKQILAGRLPYTQSLVRNLDSGLRLARLAGTLFRYGHKLNWQNINLLPQTGQTINRNIPPYPWDYSSGPHWFESRAAMDIRNRHYPRHELLGSQQPAGNGIDWSWRNSLRLSEVPWVSDHQVEGQIIFPAAGYMAMAIEAISQVGERSFSTTTEDPTFEFHNMSLNAALVLDDENSVSETELHTIMSLRKLSRRQTSSTIYDFSISSWKKQQTILHCSGSIRVLHSSSNPGVTVQDTIGYRTWPMEQWYEKGKEEGLIFGPQLRSIVALRADGNRERSDSICITRTKPPDVDHPTQGYRIHPIVIDACLQSAILSAASGNLNMFRPYLPVFIPECRIRSVALAGPSTEAFIHVRSQKTGISTLTADCTLRDIEGRPLMDLFGVKLSLYYGKIHEERENSLHLQRQPVMRVHWKPDITQLHAGIQTQLDDYILAFIARRMDQDNDISPLSTTIGALIDLLGHKNPRMRVLDIGDRNRCEAQYYLNLLDHGTAFPRYRSWNSAKIDNDGELSISKTAGDRFDLLIHEVSIH